MFHGVFSFKWQNFSKFSCLQYSYIWKTVLKCTTKYYFHFCKKHAKYFMGKMSREHHKFFEKIFSNLQIWKIMGAAMGDPNVLHHKQMLPKHFQCVIISLGIRWTYNGRRLSLAPVKGVLPMEQAAYIVLIIIFATGYLLTIKKK